jgi:hypothetical protein
MPPWDKYSEAPAAPAQAEAGPWSKYSQGSSGAKGVMETVQDATTGLGPGIMANFSDEVFAAGMTPFEMAKGYLTGRDDNLSFKDRINSAYERALKFNRDYEAAASARSPIATEVGKGVGAVMVGGRSAPANATFGQTVRHSAKVGGVYGGLAGAGEGETMEERLSGGTEGAVKGYLLGGAVPVGVEGIVRGAGKVAAPIRSAVRSLTDMEAEGGRRIVETMTRGRGLSSPQFAAEKARGTPVTNMDLGGKQTGSLARAAADTDENAAAILSDVTQGRAAGQSQRIAGWFDNEYPSSGRAMSDLIEESKLEAARTNKPLYDRAYRDGNVAIWDDELELLTQSPEVQRAIKIALIKGKDWAVKEGRTPPSGPFKFQGGQMVPNETNGSRVMPNLQFWDYVKRGLDGAGDPPSAQLARILRDQLDNYVPSYKAARGSAAKYFGEQDALEAGAKTAKGQVDVREMNKQLGRYSAKERELFEQGFSHSMVGAILKNPDSGNLLNKLNNNPSARVTLQKVLGNKWPSLEARLHAEKVMQAHNETVNGNSKTARYLVGLGLTSYAGGTIGSGSANPMQVFSNPVTYMTAALGFGLSKGKAAAMRAVDKRLAVKMAEMLTSDDPTVLAKGFKIVANNQRLMNALRHFDSRLGGIAAQQAPRGAITQGTIPGAAEEEQE